MADDSDTNLIIVSDLHLSLGFDPRTQTYDRLEDFFYDREFGHFVRHFIAHEPLPPGQHWNLVILGDFVDFWQVEHEEGEGYRARFTTGALSVKKLERVEQGHRPVFDVLAEFVAAGHRLSLVVGNHDSEFAWPEVQQRFKEMIAGRIPGGNGQRIVEANVEFYEWIFYRQGLVYAEHGHQYAAETAVPTVMWPFEPKQENVTGDDASRHDGGATGRPKRWYRRRVKNCRSVVERVDGSHTDDRYVPEELYITLGQEFVFHMFNRVEWLDPFSDNIKPISRYLAVSIRNKPVIAIHAAAIYLIVLFRELINDRRKKLSLVDDDQEMVAEAYRTMFIEDPRYYSRIGLPPETLALIDREPGEQTAVRHGTKLQLIWHHFFHPLVERGSTLLVYALVVAFMVVLYFAVP